MRVLVPEILDHLAPDDPRALRSRRDLARINWVMCQAAIMANTLADFPAPKTIADIGGGDGRFLLSVARRLVKRWPGVKLVILDQQAIVSTETQSKFAALGWDCAAMQGDIFQTLPQIAPDIVTVNLFLHHLEDAALARLLALVARRAKGFAACEPRRSAFALLASHLVFALGANDVTRHDAVASVRAGFRDSELSHLWPQAGAWRLGEQAAFPFTHVFKAHAI
ncbi:MAG: methyltransferase domain-containing protein [Alphaproteobacteria bacterium]|nr:methyltransferase domain-containing protein [Alphaproteobacteria bacterium]